MSLIQRFLVWIVVLTQLCAFIKDHPLHHIMNVRCRYECNRIHLRCKESAASFRPEISPQDSGSIAMGPSRRALEDRIVVDIQTHLLIRTCCEIWRVALLKKDLCKVEVLSNGYYVRLWSLCHSTKTKKYTAQSTRQQKSVMGYHIFKMNSCRAITCIRRGSRLEVFVLYLYHGTAMP